MYYGKHYRAILKMNRANEHGYSVIRILQTDVWEDVNEWQKNLHDEIKLRDQVWNIFIGGIYYNFSITLDDSFIFKVWLERNLVRACI